jgi:hypothetical protein
MPLTSHDLNRFGYIVQGEGDWFMAQLIRLIHKADKFNRNKIRQGFPYEVFVVELWESASRMEWVQFVKGFEEKENSNDGQDQRD